MYSWEKPLKEEKLRKNPRNPSFSSTLLDEIYRSIDDGDDRKVTVHKEKFTKKHSNKGSVRAKTSTSSIEDEEMASLRRACLIEKWMEKKVNDKVSARRGSSLPENNDPLFFSSSSSSSDSSSGVFSSSEADSFAPVKSRSSCFAASRPKPIRTVLSGQSVKSEKCVGFREQSELYVFDDYRHRTNKIEEGLVKSKTKALQIYANLKKAKQPISPGGRLTTFLNSLFTNGNAKKTNISNSGGNVERKSNSNGYVERKSKSTQASICSSASSFSRSCLSKSSPRTREKRNNGIKRTVRFYPVSVIVDEDCHPCGHKCISDEDSKKFAKSSTWQANEDQRKLRQNQNKNDFVARKIEEDDYDDAASDSSSDLFELDHLAFFKNDRFCEELPVYETTHLDTNRAIASGLIR